MAVIFKYATYLSEGHYLSCWGLILEGHYLSFWVSILKCHFLSFWGSILGCHFLHFGCPFWGVISFHFGCPFWRVITSHFGCPFWGVISSHFGCPFWNVISSHFGACPKVSFPRGVLVYTLISYVCIKPGCRFLISARPGQAWPSWPALAKRGLTGPRRAHTGPGEPTKDRPTRAQGCPQGPKSETSQLRRRD